MVTEVPSPEIVLELAGFVPITVTVHPPELGKFINVTEPVANAQVGCVGTPAMGV